MSDMETEKMKTLINDLLDNLDHEDLLFVFATVEAFIILKGTDPTRDEVPEVDDE